MLFASKTRLHAARAFRSSSSRTSRRSFDTSASGGASPAAQDTSAGSSAGSPSNDLLNTPRICPPSALHVMDLHATVHCSMLVRERQREERPPATRARHVQPPRVHALPHVAQQEIAELKFTALTATET